MSKITHGLIVKKSKNYSFKSIIEINKTFGEKRIGVVREDFGEKIFLQHGGNPILLHQLASGEQLVKMLKFDRVDAISLSEIITFGLMKKEKINHLDYELVYTFTKVSSGYAFNKKVSPEIIKELQKAYEELYEDGTVMRIRNSYIAE